MLIHKSRDILKARFKKDPDLLVQAPGRINIMGEHTDYNHGLVLPAAIDHYIYMAFAKNSSETVNIVALDPDESESFDIGNSSLTEYEWANLIKGVLLQLKGKISGFDLVFCGDIPEGAGLASSAALCSGIAFGLNQLFKLDMKKWDLVKAAQKSEHDFLGVQVGIMDPFASIFGMTNHVLMLDCLNLTFSETDVDQTGYKFLLLDSKIKHELNHSAYSERKKESARALEILKLIYPKVKTYRDVTVEVLEKTPMDLTLRNRAHHIISENLRVQEVTKVLQKHKMEKLGDLLNEGHASLKYDFEITSTETDFLQEILNDEPNVLGAKQVGRGFGGCILCVVKDQGVDDMVGKVQEKYKKKYALELNRIPIRISKGCHVIDDI